MARAILRLTSLVVALAGAAGGVACSPSPAGNGPPATNRVESPPTGTRVPPGAPPAAPPPEPKPAPGVTQPAEKGPAFLDAGAKHDGKTLAEWIARLGGADESDRAGAADAVAKYGPNAKAAVPALAALLKTPDGVTFIPVLTAVAAIGPGAGAAVEPLVALLGHKDGTVRALAAGVLADLGPPAGKAVPALIAAANDSEVGTDANRDSVRSAARAAGKYDIRSVFAAVRRGKLTDLDMGSVIDSLGPDDAHAAAGLAAEVGGRDLADYAVSGLRRIGPKAAPALPALRALLSDKDPAVRRGAAEAVAAIGEVAGPKPGGPKKDAGPEDVRQTLARAGFDEKADWGRHLTPYARFGTKAAADKYARGDRFDKIEVDKASRAHRGEVRGKRFLITGLPIRPVVRDDVETRGLVVELPLPMRVRGETPFYEDPAALSGALAGLHPSELDPRQSWFLTKDGQIRACTPAEAQLVARNGGVLYHPEVAHTTLVLTLKGELDALKEIARDAGGYSVELEFTGLHFGRPLAWGYFRRDAHHDADWDCQKVWVDYLLDKDAPQPGYFPTAFADANPSKVPEFAWAKLEALRVVGKAGKVIGGYGAR